MHPAFHLGPLTLHLYGLFLGLAIWGGWLYGVQAGIANGIPPRRMRVMAFFMVLSAVFSARLFHLFVNHPPAEALRGLFSLRHAGFSSYGGFLGGTISVAVGALFFRIPFRRYTDAMGPAMLIGLAVSRIGCFLYGCDFGIRYEGPLAVTFPGSSPLWPQGSPAWQLHLAQGLIGPGAARSLPVFPVQLLSSCNAALLLALLLWIKRAWRGRFDGALFALFWLLYGTTRAGLELLREDPQRGWVVEGVVTLPMAIGLLSAGLCGVLLLAGLRWARPREASGEPGA